MQLFFDRSIGTDQKASLRMQMSGTDKIDANLALVADDIGEVVSRTPVELGTTEDGKPGVWKTGGAGRVRQLLGVLEDVELGDLAQYSVEVRSVRRVGSKKSTSATSTVAAITVRVTRANGKARVPSDSLLSLSEALAADEELELLSRDELRRLAADEGLLGALRVDASLVEAVERVVRAPTWEAKRAVARDLLAEESSSCRSVEAAMATAMGDLQ